MNIMGEPCTMQAYHQAPVKLHTVTELLQNEKVLRGFAKAVDYLTQVIADNQQKEQAVQQQGEKQP